MARCIECRDVLTAENDGGGIEYVGEGWVCEPCDTKNVAKYRVEAK